MKMQENHRYKPGIRVTLWLIVLSCVLPIAAVGVFFIFSLYHSQKNELAGDAVDFSRAIGSALDRELASTAASLRGLSTSRALKEGRYDQVYQQAVDLLNYVHAEGIVLLDAKGHAVFSTNAPFGAALPTGADAPGLVAGAVGQDVEISNLETVAGLRSVTISVPVKFDGRLRYVLSARVGASQLRALLTEQHISPDWRCSILDKSGVIVARAHHTEQYIGVRASQDFLSKIGESAEGSFDSIALDGVPVLSAYSRAPVSGWTVAIGIPIAELTSGLQETLIGLIFATAAALALGLAVAWYIAGGLGRAIDTIKASALSLIGGAAVEPQPIRVREISEVADAIDTVSRLLDQRTRALEESNATLRESGNALKLAQNTARLGSWYWHASTDAFQASVEVSHIFNIEWTAASGPMQKLLPPDVWHQLRSIFEQVAASGEAAEADLHCARVDGSPLWIHVVGDPEFSDMGTVAGVRGIVQDITARKEAEESLEAARESSQAELERQVAERTQSIARLNRDLEERTREAEAANASKGAFLATISHEIRTPLNAVVGLSGLLMDSPLDQMQREYVKNISSSAQALRVLIDDVLDFSKIEADALVLEQAPFSLNGILKTVAAIASAGTLGKAIEVVIDVNSEMPDALIGDTLRLQQVLLNLVGNAIKFTESGEIVVSASLLSHVDGRVSLQFSVRDTGIGIPKEKLAHIFEAFVQADTSTSRRFGGTGLGLAICHRLVLLMGGEINVFSEVGKGSEFVFSVTVGLDKKSMVPHASEELRDLNILAADDHPLVRKVLANLGQSLHWHVTTLESGAQVLEELRRSRSEGRYYDYLLLDWHMPGMDGMETLKQAKAARDITLPLTLLMASAFELDRALAGEDYGDLDGVLAKPVTAAGLYEAISHVHAGEVLQFTPSPLKNAGRLQGMRLLVAEDNDMNQHVIEQILTRAGADVTIAANGFAAVEVLRADQGFDAVIMDVQMPVMDGYAATEAIRNELGLSELPIYALTAHASPHDRDLSRKAGMNGHIVKPIDVDLLFSMLRGRQAALSTDAAPAPPDEAEPAALPELDLAAGLRNFAGEKAKYYELLRGFAQGHGSDAELAFRLYREGDAGGAAKLVHDLCGMAAVLHAARLRTIASDLEKSLRAGVEAGAGFAPLREAMHDLLERIEDQVERPSV